MQQINQMESSAVAEIIKERRGEVPFLNGGLFEMQKDDVQNAVHIPNDANLPKS